MSEEINDGGEAFPCGFHPEGNSADHDGMTLRDYFAAQALAGLCADPENQNSISQNAQSAYKLADAMIKAQKNHTD